MTDHERLIVLILFEAESDPATAEAVLGQLTGSARVFEPLSAAAVFSRSIAEQELARS